jgi:hypothetical protein
MSQTDLAGAEVRRAPCADGPAVSARWRLLAGAAGFAGAASTAPSASPVIAL